MPVRLVPQPQQCHELPGKFIMHADTRLVISEDTPLLREMAEYLAGKMRPATSFAFPISVEAGETPGTIALRLLPADAQLGEEGYRLRVTPDYVVLAAPTRAGLFYAIQSWLLLLPAQITSAWHAPCMDPLPPDVVLPPGWEPLRWTAPCVEITDWPRFAFRGFMLDCSRHFRSLETLKWCVDKLAQLKMNHFHLHLSDNHGWRVEIPKWPKLTEVGSRVEPEPRRQGFYTAADIRELVAYAASHNITVIPEIDVPGHIYAAVAAYPELCCTGAPRRNDMSHFHQLDILCAGNERVFTFLEDVFSELMNLFPGPYMHIGGDEAPKRRWRNCPKCQQRMRDEGIPDVEELQGYLTRRIVDFVRSRGRRVIGWEEMVHGNVPQDCIVQWWRRGTGNAGALEGLKRGHQLIVSRGDFSYLGGWRWQLPDFYQASYFPSELQWDRQDEVTRTDPPEWANIIGAECCLWGESTPDSLLASRLFPTILANAELQWRYPSHRSLDDFLKRVSAMQSHVEGTPKLHWGS